jgi:hypothetical protein
VRTGRLPRPAHGFLTIAVAAVPVCLRGSRPETAGNAREAAFRFGACRRALGAALLVFAMLQTLTPAGGAAQAAPASSDLAKAQAFVADLRMGVAVERTHWQALRFRGAPIASGSAYWSYLAGLGITHVHFEIPYGFSGAARRLGPAEVQQFMTVVYAALNGGLKVILNLMDVFDLGDAQSNAYAINNYLAAAAGIVAAQGFDRSRIAIGSAEEFGGGTNAAWNPIMRDWLTTLRRALPGYVLAAGAANWNYYGGVSALNSYNGGTGLLGDQRGGDPFRPLGDRLVIYDFHTYDPLYFPKAPNLWSVAATAIAAWQSGAGEHRPVYAGEVGTTAGKSAPFDPRDLVPMAQGMGQYAPCPWAITGGGSTYNRINISGGDAALSPAMEAAFRAASQVIANAAYFGYAAVR